MSRTILLLASFWLFTAASLSCAQRQVVRHRRITGTCGGACKHYLTCKDALTKRTFKVCVSECRETFSGAEGLKAFESLTCKKAVSFIEGSRGRGPGSTP